MVDIAGILKLEGKNEQIFNNIVQDGIKHGLFATEEEAIAGLAELAGGKEGININAQIGLDNDWGIEILLDAWKEEITRVLNNPKYNILFKATQIVTSDKSVPGPNGTSNTITTIRITGLIKIKNQDGSFFSWEYGEGGTDTIIGSIKAEGNTNKRKLQHIKRDKTYAMEACSKGPENRFPYFEVDDRCDNAQEINHTFPSFIDIVTKIYGEPIPITEMSQHKSSDGFDFKLMKGRVSGIRNPKQGSISMSFNLADSSVTIEDINTKKFGAYLRVVTDINTVSSLGFGNNSYVIILSKINKNEPRPGFEIREEDSESVVAFYPAIIYPIVRQNEDTIASGPNTVGENAESVKNKIAGIGKGIPQTPQFPTPRPADSVIPKPQVEIPKIPKPSKLKAQPQPEPQPEPEVEVQGSEKNWQSMCDDFGNYDKENQGCIDCKANEKDLFYACVTQ